MVGYLIDFVLEENLTELDRTCLAKIWTARWTVAREVRKYAETS